MTAKELAKTLNVHGDDHKNCCQSVFAAMCVAELGEELQPALDVGACFGGGMLCGEGCGAVVGSLMYLGHKYGEGEQTIEKGLKLTEDFKARNGGLIRCAELTDPSRGDKEAICPKLIETCIELLGGK